MFFNQAGGEKYLLAIIIAASKGADNWDSRPYTSCANGHGKFKHCITVPGLMNGACINCGYDIHYEKCSFVNNPPMTDEAMAQALDAQLNVSPARSGGHSRTSSRSVFGAAGGSTEAVGSPMRMSGASNRGQALSSQQQQAPGGFTRWDGSQINGARETPPLVAPTSAATGATQLLLNINTTQQHNSRAELAEEVRHILLSFVQDRDRWAEMLGRALDPKASSSKKGPGPGSPGAGSGSPGAKGAPSYTRF